MQESYELSKSNKSLPSDDFTKFEAFLESFDLPSDNVVASSTERRKIMQVLPDFLLSLPPETKKSARYLSKFVASSAVGLFDAALNYVWNEVVINLRRKVLIYGIDYFFDSAVGGLNRELYSKEEDLLLLRDSVLIDTCKKLELISDILHRKLSYILDMRNQIGASHPCEYSINAYELLGWLQDCINGVLKDDISKSAITVKQIIDNTKKAEGLIQNESLKHFENSIKKLSSNTISNLLVSIFGIFVSPLTTSKITLENMLNLGLITWKYANEEIRYELGKKVDIYRANLDNYKISMAESFFKNCNGQNYYTNDTKIIKITSLCEQLESARIAWDNYIYEAPIAKEIMCHIKSINDIPEIRFNTIATVFLKCRIGKNCAYCNGVSPHAKKYYDNFFNLLDENAVMAAIKILMSSNMEPFLYGAHRKINLIEIFCLMKSNVFSEGLKEMLDYVISFNGPFEFIFKDLNCKRLLNKIL